MGRHSEDRSVVDRLTRLQQAVSAGGEYFDPFVAARAQDDLQRAEERLRLGRGVTVAALIGGTGSGKSTLFNAITELDFADAGELRPTTERAAGCTWNVDATALLDYLDVAPERRIEHESILTRGRDNLDGLVLLDLPDHDSIKVDHSAQVTRLIPMVDLLIWVVDPQKYADQILHQGYLESLQDRSEALIFVLNQVDTIPADGHELIIDDLRKLLAKNGLGEVPIFATSALYGEGLEPVMDELEKAVHGPSVATRTASVELDAIAARLRDGIGGQEAELSEEVARMNDRIIRASGIPAVVESIRAAGQSAMGTALVKPEQPANTMTVAIRDAWVSHVRQGLPGLWREAVVEDIAGADRLRRAIGGALEKVALPDVGRGLLRWILAGVGVAALGIVLAIVGFPVSGPARWFFFAAGVFGGLLIYVWGRQTFRRRAATAAERYEATIRSEVAQLTDDMLVAGPKTVLARYRQTREALQPLE